ncbi:MAG: PEP-CTERM sorting domain-containing protein [Rhodospirillaceae bacterium]|jgi:hypothetical protein|nr:PEP-CTERM sorting domain-containing protein [Rhodospirillaceae bacterium]
MFQILKRLKTSILAVGLIALPSLAFADSIAPTSFTDTLAVGESVTIRKTVTVTSAPPVDAKIDVLFFADTTGSMSSALSSVKASIAAITAAVDPLGDVQWGVSEYKDITDVEPVRPYELRQDITNDNSLVAAAVAALSAGGGGDTPEGQLPALKEAAETTSWRAGSARILVWFGDALGHDPRDGVTESDAITALQAENIEVQAVGVTSGANNFDSTGQASRITAATGGSFTSGVAGNNVADALIASITSAIDTYSVVSLDLSEAPAGVTVGGVPGSIVGAFDRSVERTFDFDVTFTGVAPGDFFFDIFATVDGGRVATEADHITVGITDVPEPGTLGTLGLGIALLGFARRKRRTHLTP